MPGSAGETAPPAVRRHYAFGEFTLDVERGTLRRANEDVKLRPKSFEVLRYLIERHDRLVTKRELLDAVWGQAVVTEGALTQCLIEIRRAIGDDAQRLIRTLPRRGFIFDVPVTTTEDGHGPNGLALNADLREPARSARWLVGWLFAAACIGLALFAAVWWTVTDRGGQPTTSGQTTVAQSPPVSIAVLPFVDMSPGQDQEYFADGLSEELLNLLAQIPSLTVIARTSSFSFKEQNVDVATIAGKLGVSHVLEGSVRKAADQVRVTVQLVDTATSAHAWSATYDRKLDDLFAVQDEIAASVAYALELRLVAGELRAAPTSVNSVAHERFLQAQYFYNRRAPGDVERARDYYQQALDIDPDFAHAWVGLAAAYHVQIHDGEIPVETGTAPEGHAVERAVALAPNLAEAHVRAARYYGVIGAREKAGEHLRKAKAMDPDSPLVLAVLANEAAWQGRLDEAIELQRRVVTLDPVGAAMRGGLANLLLAAGRLTEARAEYLRMLELSPAHRAEIELDLAWILILEEQFDQAVALIEQWPAGEDRDLGLVLANHGLGRESEAEAALARLIAAPGVDAAIHAAEVHAHRGELDEAFRWLDTARDRFGPQPMQPSRWRSVARIQFSPFLRVVRGDPRWDARQAWYAGVSSPDTPASERAVGNGA